MILPDFVLDYCVNKTYVENGIDCFAECKDRLHFIRYPHKISYEYNSRGFRDAEWPESIDELKECIWCVGDSFTVGIGNASNHVWSNMLQDATGRRCINVSMDGASNIWIARKVNRILEEINPKFMVIQWSYVHRDESDDTSLTDDLRRIHYRQSDDFKILPQIQRTEKCIESLHQTQAQIIHSFIPKWCELNEAEIRKSWNCFGGEKWPACPDNLDGFKQIHRSVLNEFEKYSLLDIIVDYFHSADTVTRILSKIDYVPEIDPFDLARDAYHYGPRTTDKFVKDVVKLLNL